MIYTNLLSIKPTEYTKVASVIREEIIIATAAVLLAVLEDVL